MTATKALKVQDEIAAEVTSVAAIEGEELMTSDSDSLAASACKCHVCFNEPQRSDVPGAGILSTDSSACESCHEALPGSRQQVKRPLDQSKRDQVPLQSFPLWNLADHHPTHHAHGTSKRVKSIAQTLGL